MKSSSRQGLEGKRSRSERLRSHGKSAAASASAPSGARKLLNALVGECAGCGPYFGFARDPEEAAVGGGR